MDYGCGNGVNINFFKKLKSTTIGVEASENAVIKCKKKVIKPVFYIKNLNKLLKYKFDVIYSNQSIYNLENSNVNFFNKIFLSNTKKKWNNLFYFFK